MKSEKRDFYIKNTNLEIRANDENGVTTITGLIPYDSYSEEMWGFREIIRKGCFTKSIKEGDIRALYNHDTALILGRNKAETLRFNDTDKGLEFEIDLPDTTYAQDLVKSVKRGDITGNSFGFRVIKDLWNHDSDPITRELLEVRLIEVSIVAFPAYTESKISARDLFSSIGLNFDKLTAAIENRKKTDSEKDTIYIKEVVTKLSALISESEGRSGADENHSDNEDNEPDNTLELRKRKLQLIKLKK